MLLSLLALLLIIGSLLAFNRGCSFSPGPPDADPATAPSVDAAVDLARYARSTDFAIRSPAVPAQWRANSTSSGPVEPASVVVRVGWITPGRFVQLSQSSAEPAEVVRVETDQESAPTGSLEVGGRSWTVYPGRRDEHAWATRLDGVTLMITGNGTDEEFRTLATAVLSAPPLPRT
jgi:hypothetical protein